MNETTTVTPQQVISALTARAVELSKKYGCRVSVDLDVNSYGKPDWTIHATICNQSVCEGGDTFAQVAALVEARKAYLEAEQCKSGRLALPLPGTPEGDVIAAWYNPAAAIAAKPPTPSADE